MTKALICLADENHDGEYFGGERWQGADLYNASFQRCNFSDADLRNTDCRFANFSKADLRHTDFTGATFEETIFEGARYDDETKWPNGIVPIGAIKK